MPIPQYERQVKAAPVPGVMAPGAGPLSAYGGGDETAKAFASSGALASDAAAMLWQKAKEAKDEIETARISGAAAELSKLQTKLLHDPETGALNKQGENSFETYQPTMDAFKKGAADIASSLTTPEQRAKFQAHVDNAGAQMDQSLNVHISGQRKEYAATNFTGAAEQYANAAEANALTNIQVAKQNIRLQTGELIKLAQSKGLSPDATRAFIADQESKTQTRMVRLMIANGKDQMAKAYYDSLPPDTFRNQDAVEVAQAVEAGSFRGDAQRETLKIFAPELVVTKTFDQGNQIKFRWDYKDPTESETYAAVDKIKDPKLQDEVRNRVSRRWSDKRRMTQDEENDNIKTASDFIAEAASKPEQLETKDGDMHWTVTYGPPRVSMDAIPPDLLKKLPYRAQASLQNWVEELRKGNAPRPNGDEFIRLQLLAGQDPDKFARGEGENNPYLYRGKMTDPEFKELLNLKRSIQNKDGKAAEKLKGFLSLEEIANLRLAKLHLVQYPNKEQFKRILNEDFVTFKSTHDGKEPDQYQMYKMVDTLLADDSRWYNPFSWFGKKYGFETTEAFYKKVESIPQSEITAIEGALKAKGEVPTRERVLDLYMEMNQETEKQKRIVEKANKP